LIDREKHLPQGNDPDYVYRPPWWAVAALVGALWTVPALNLAAVVWLKREGPWNAEVTWGCLLLSGASLSGWLLSKMEIVVGSEGVRFPLSRSKLLWEDVADYTLGRSLGIEWVSIVDRRGKAFRILLTPPGGRELRKRLLAKLGLEHKDVS
jgi:hypothetical protein